MAHIHDNITKDVLKSMSHFESFQELFRPMIDLFSNDFYRSRLIETCFRDSVYMPLFKQWRSGNYIQWRWNSLAQCAAELSLRKGGLLSNWSAEKFNFGRSSNAGAENRDRAQRRGEDSATAGYSKMAAAVDRAVKSPYFWSYLSMVELLAGFSADLMGWCEGCSCEHHQYIQHMPQSSYHRRTAETSLPSAICLYSCMLLKTCACYSEVSLCLKLQVQGQVSGELGSSLSV